MATKKTYLGWTICGHERYGIQENIYWQMRQHVRCCITCRNSVYFIQEWKPSHIRGCITCRDEVYWHHVSQLTGIRKKLRFSACSIFSKKKGV